MKVPLTVLPLNFLNFRANKQSSCVKLDWSIVEDLDTDHYEIERSIDNMQFAKLSSVPASTSANFNAYSFIDLLPEVPNNFYRIKQVGKDGKLFYSKTLPINFTTGTVSIFPNPIQDHLTISLGSITHRENLEIIIYNIAGSRLKSFQYNNQPNNIILNLAGLIRGQYICEVIGDKVHYSETFTKF